MSAYIDISIKANSNEDANKATSIMKETASKRTPEYPTEIEKFIADITVDGNTVKVDESYSLMSDTFSELIPQIMRNIADHGIKAITMEAWFTSLNCGYEAEFCGRVFKNGNCRTSFKEFE